MHDLKLVSDFWQSSRDRAKTMFAFWVLYFWAKSGEREVLVKENFNQSLHDREEPDWWSLSVPLMTCSAIDGDIERPFVGGFVVP